MFYARPLAALASLLILAACASAEVTQVQKYQGETTQLPRPDRVVIYDFAYSPETAQSPESAGAASDGNQVNGQPQLTEQQVAFGRAVSDLLQGVLVEEILAMGLPAERIENLSSPLGNMLLIHGQFLSVDEGSRAARMLVGFGAGRTKVVTRTQVYYYTAERQDLLKELEAVATSGSKPGFILPLGVGTATGKVARSAVIGGGVAVAGELGADVEADTRRTGEELAAALKVYFEQQGWL